MNQELTRCLIKGLLLFLFCVEYTLSVSIDDTCKISSECKEHNGLCINGKCMCAGETVDDNGGTAGGSCVNRSDFIPSDAYASIIKTTHIKLEWTVPKAISAIRNFSVIYSKAFNSDNHEISVPKRYTLLSSRCLSNQNGFSTVLENLKSCTLYHIQIQSVLYTGERVGVDIYKYTKPTDTTVFADRNPTAPTVVFWWVAYSCGSYNVTIKGLGNSFYFATVTERTRLTLSSFKPGMRYEITVRIQVPGLTVGGRSTYKTIQIAQTPPGPPQNLRYETFNNNAIELNWDEPSDPNGFVDYYLIEIRVDGKGLNETVVTPFRATSWTLSDSFQGKNYCFSVYSHNDGGFNSTKAAHICRNSRNGKMNSSDERKEDNSEDITRIYLIATTSLFALFALIGIIIIILLCMKLQRMEAELEKCKTIHYEAPVVRTDNDNYLTLI